MYTRLRSPGSELVLKYTRDGDRLSADSYSSPIAATSEAADRAFPGFVSQTRLTTNMFILPNVRQDASRNSESTVSREAASNGGRHKYRAHVAHGASRIRARRPKPSKLAYKRHLREAVEEETGLVVVTGPDLGVAGRHVPWE